MLFVFFHVGKVLFHLRTAQLVLDVGAAQEARRNVRIVFVEGRGFGGTYQVFGVNAVFSNTDGTELFKDKASSDRLFSFIYCTINKGTINVRFPVTETIDHYPDCDGEYDRYSVKIVDNIIITYPVTSKA